MPAIQGRTALTANSTSENVVEGSNFEFIAVRSIVTVAAILVSADDADVQAFFTLGGASLLQPPYARLFPGGDQKIPNNIYHNIVRVGADAGERIFLTFTNGSSSAQNVNWVIRIDPV